MLPRDRMRRRTLLQALGLGGGAALMSPLNPLFSRPARADVLGAATRIVFYVTSHGTVYPNWRMRTEGQGDDVDFETDLNPLDVEQFSPILAPLHDMRDKLLVLDGLANSTGRTPGLNEHELGHASILTGRIPIEGNGSLATPTGWSIDQAIADSLEDNGVFNSLEYAVGGWEVCYDQMGQRIPYENDVWEAYQRLFPNGQQDPGADPTDAQRIATAQTSLMDLVGDRYDAMLPRLSGSDRLKLEQHRDLLRDLEQTLAELGELECEVPPAPSGAPMWDTAGYPAWHEDVFFGLTRVALSCGLSKVVTIRHDIIPNATLGVSPGDLHNDVAHSAEDDPASAAIMTDYHLHQANAFRRLIGQLDSIPEGSGTMLDNTIVVWTNELSTGSHRMTDIPLVVAGGSNYFDLGRYVRWAPTDLLQAPWSQESVGPAHNKFLTMLGRAMGMDINAFGDVEVPRAGGGSIDTSGILDRVALS
jgi:hypothetical protein